MENLGGGYICHDSGRCIPGEGYKHRLTAILLSIAVAISGWIVPAQQVYAYSSTTIKPSMSGGYIYIPTSIGCPQFPFGERFILCTSGPVQYSAFINCSSATVVGSNIRYAVTMVEKLDWNSGSCERTVLSATDWYAEYLVKSVGATVYYNGSHSFSTISNATCTTAAVVRCSCGLTQTTGSALGHSYTVKQADATCTTNQVNKCSRCSSTSQVANTALGHDWDSGTPTPDATPYTSGIMTYTCQRDGTHQRTEVIPQKHFQIYSGSSRIQKLYLGTTLIMNSSAGNNALVK